MLVFMVTKDDFDRYGIWKTFIGTKQPSITEMLEFGKWAVFKPIGLLMQATIIDFNTEDDALESSESIEIASQYASTSSALMRPLSKTHNPAADGNIPKAPPPPVPPPLPIMSTPQSNNDDDLKCKKVSWKELKIDMENTIWDRVNQNLANGEVIVDKKEIMELFREKPRKSRKFSGLSPGSTNTDNILTLTGKKQLNISIALAHHQLYADDLIKAVTNVDVRLLEADFLSTIENFLPDQKEETSLIQKYSSRQMKIEREILTDPEEFSFLLSSVPQFRKRIRAMVFQCSFYDRVNAICKNFEAVRQSIEEIRKSERLEKILMHILSTGKIMNNTATKAFNIDFLPSASCCKTSDGDSNFLAYVTSKIESHDPKILKLSEELPSLGQAVKVSLIEVDRGCTELAVEYSSIAMELEAIAADSEGLKDFLQKGKLDLNNIKRKRRQMQQELNELGQYFGIDPSKTKPTELFGIFKQFLNDLSSAIETTARKSQRNRQMNRSTSAPNFRRSSRNSSFRGSRNSSTRSSRNSSFRKSGRSSSITSNFSDVTCASNDTSFTDGSGIVFESKDSINVSREIDIEEVNSPTLNKFSNGVLMQKSTSADSAKSSSPEDKMKVVEKDGGGWPRSPLAKRSSNGPLDKLSSEDIDFTSKKELLRKVLLSPVKEKPERSRNAANEARKLQEISTERRKKPERLSNARKIKQSEVNDLVGGNEKQLVEKRNKDFRPLKESKVKESVVSNGVSYASKKPDLNFTIQKNGDVITGSTVKLTQDKKSANIVYNQKRKDDSPAFIRSSSLRRSNRKVTKVSIKSMQAKEVQKAKKLILSKSESSLSTARNSFRKPKLDGVQSVILKPGFIEKLLPMKCGIKEMNNNDLENYQSSRTLERNPPKEEKTLRRTKSAVISRNKQKASLIIFV